VFMGDLTIHAVTFADFDGCHIVDVEFGESLTLFAGGSLWVSFSHRRCYFWADVG